LAGLRSYRAAGTPDAILFRKFLGKQGLEKSLEAFFSNVWDF
jgi:hypothetical protein